nr:MAG TPA: hypothetical protein [Caudoviricetes sp.]
MSIENIATIATVIGTFVATLASLFGGLSWFVARMDKKFEAVDKRFEKQEEKFDQKLDKLEQRVDAKLTDIKNEIQRVEKAAERADATLRTELARLAEKGEERGRQTLQLREKFNRLVAILEKAFPEIMFNDVTMKASPRKLSPIGEMIYKEIDGDTFLNENEIRLFQYIDDMKPRVALDVEMYAFSACRSLSSLPVFDRLKDYIFNRADIDGENGKISLSIAIVCEVLAIPLRDRYMASRGIKAKL